MSVNEKCIGYAVKLIKENNDDSYLIQNFKFKFNSTRRDSTQFGYTKLKSPTEKTKKDSYIHDIETAEIIINVMKLYDMNGQIYKVIQKENGKLILEVNK
ncbi:hypothetical protein ACG95N_11775 [Acinetobacter guillouiae]|uniref:hypothetical protein n=1 Tax=Acinetobacter guillouiae TaxID=106649 RepID=UPI003AF5D879